MKLDRRHFLLAAGALAGAPLLARAANQPRVITLEYHATEMALALGLRPVGVADAKGYARWVGYGKAQLAGVANVGSRQQPSLEAMARLKPDLIVGVDFRHASLRGLFSRIAPTLLLPSPELDGLASVYADYRQFAQAVERQAAAERDLLRLDQALAEQRAALARAGWTGQPLAILQSIGGVSQMWAFAGNSVPGGIQKALGLTGPWLDTPARQGVETKTVEDLLTLQTSIALLSDGRSKLVQDPVWQRVPAIRAGRMAELPAGLWPFGGPASTPRLVHTLGQALLALKPA